MARRHQTYFSASGQDTLIGAGMAVIGNLSVLGDLFVEGVVKGTITVTGGIIVGINSTIGAEIKADSVSISGEVAGDIHATGLVTIREMGAVNGNIDCERLTIMPGGLFDGNSRLRDTLKRRISKINHRVPSLPTNSHDEEAS